MRNKICLITGATSGIGRATALALARRDATLILVGRNERAGSRLVKAMTHGGGQAGAEFLRADLSSQQAVQELAREVIRRHSRIDVLIHNAGARFDEYGETVDGIERTFAINHLSHFLLTLLLADPLRRAPAARIITVSSRTHRGVSGEFAPTWPPARYDRKAAYGQSKLANVLFTYELARRLQGTSITANAVDPGAVATRFGRNNGFLSWVRHLTYHALRRDLVSPAQGADTVIYLASSPEVEGFSGQFFHRRQPVKSSPESYDESQARRLWELSAKLTHMDPDAAFPFGEQSGDHS